ncbi:MAG: hypothetical protein EON55_03885 [Alphaproteobacteria bacterium]|nr:MAG: hypothetical protein EON55_03885 [Alphaproteobacteria bacterium]
MFCSLLFVPTTSARKVEKALTGAADAVIVDLENAVALAEKAQDAAGLLTVHGGKTTFVRVNALGTPFCYPDLLMAAAAAIDGVVLPKAETAADILTADWLLTQLEIQAGKQPGSRELMPIVERAKGVSAARVRGGGSCGRHGCGPRRRCRRYQPCAVRAHAGFGHGRARNGVRGRWALAPEPVSIRRRSRSSTPSSARAGPSASAKHHV